MNKLILIASQLVVLCVISAASVAEAKVKVVRQIIDVNASTPADAFRFDPKLLFLEKGETVQIVGSTGRHTVSSIKGMLPEGARAFEIRGKAKVERSFDVEGVYGIRCRVHGKHGMVMLVVVGDPAVNWQDAWDRLPKLKPSERVQFAPLMQQVKPKGL
ncbi:plastocyanin/azurin family copper-binding protein [Flexibacterium corallicola]|uniref:plastocyanin/azurin family copper-binding protein n=1 Tax=Flexibacterium corallicola TaxID=3037259 RepID=UPI00286F4B0C|nr:plastocyanin/azurin family copper-binding protein [Pseudovibrio sp. M1P-2-3]